MNAHGGSDLPPAEISAHMSCGPRAPLSASRATATVRRQTHAPCDFHGGEISTTMNTHPGFDFAARAISGGMSFQRNAPPHGLRATPTHSPTVAQR